MAEEFASETPSDHLQANTNIDDLTLALANFSRVPSPEPAEALTCCCGNDTCDNLQAWISTKSRLESRLTLSAEVGQALLHRYESLLQRSSMEAPSISDTESEDEHGRVLELIKANASLEKQLNRALVSSEITEVSSKTILNELQEAKTTISRLASHHARSVGWDTRLSAAMKEKDDMQQERDFESQRARLAESRFAALKEKTTKLQADVRRLQDELQDRREQRNELSESLILEARSKLDNLQETVGSAVDIGETTRVLESLVNDNEILKRDNLELQTMLAESREEYGELREELEEQRAQASSRHGRQTPLTPTYPGRHWNSGGAPSSIIQQHSSRPSLSDQRSRRSFEPLTPETSTRPLSPLSPGFHIEYQDPDGHETNQENSERPRTHKPLLLLTRSRGVQTDTYPGGLSPSPIPSSSIASPMDVRSESSSFSETTASIMSILIDRLVTLLNRLSQADALTLTNRLKRQHLQGADVEHLSRSTIASIVAEVTSLRSQFRVLLEDEKIFATCTRKDLRILFKLFKDAFTEMGAMRSTLNQVILDPSIANRVREEAMNPPKEDASPTDSGEGKDSSNSVGGWIAPISRLFSGNTSSSAPALVRSRSSKASSRPPPRLAPKLRPATAASTTTVNVEFTGSGVGRATTSSYDGNAVKSSGSVQTLSTLPNGTSSAVMGIFAGAPKPIPPDQDPWVVLPRSSPRRGVGPGAGATLTAGNRAQWERANKRLSRNLDAVLDMPNTPTSGRPRENEDPSAEAEDEDRIGPLIKNRTLRRRGLSDSSIHSTFMDSAPSEEPQQIDATPSSFQPGTSVLQRLSSRVQLFRRGTDSSYGFSTPTSTPAKRSMLSQGQDTSRGLSGSKFLPTLASLATADSPFASGSPPVRSEHSLRREEDLHSRDFYL